MEPRVRAYDHASDFEKVGDFLLKTFDLSATHVNWTQPRWEYMHHHPHIRGIDLTTIGVWEVKDEIVGLIHPEHHGGTAYIQVDPAHADLKEPMLAYAEEHLGAPREGSRILRIPIHDRDVAFQDIARERGYGKTEASEPMSQFEILEPFPPIALPEGFHLKGLDEVEDHWKVHSVLWRGFDHGDDPPRDGIEEREFMQSAPHFEKELNLVVEAPDGTLVSYAGMWLEPVHRLAYVEPVATDPAFRRRGLGRAAVLEGIRRCGERGAKKAIVGTALPFYLSMGFQMIFNRSFWRRTW
ncbi:MAG: GNAT family N-acetyltransferase [Planctomycetota bacterium]|jgi:GNAT superfamily N-acetyltransferase